MAAEELSEIYLAKHRIRKRGGGDLWSWFNGIDSVICPSSVKAEVFRNGAWENCMVSGVVSAESKDRLKLCLYFDDATALLDTRSKQAYLPEDFTAPGARTKATKKQQQIRQVEILEKET